MTLDEKTIEKILKGDDLSKVENKIGRLTNRHVNRDHLNFTIGIIKRDVANSGLGLDTIMGIIINESDKLIEFGVEVLSDKEATKHEEEYPEGEGPNDN